MLSHRSKKPHLGLNPIQSEFRLLTKSEDSVQIQRSEQDVWAELNAIYNAPHVGLCFIDRSLRYVRINECLAKTNGRSVAEHIGKTIRDILGKLADQFEPMCHHVLTGKPLINFEALTAAPSDPHALRKWLLNCYPAQNSYGDVIGLVAIISDITDQKALEQRMCQANEELKRLIEIKSDFASVVSHELRTPLMAIQEGINLILDGVEGPILDGQRDTLEITQRNVERLTRLINSVLDFSRIESGRMGFSFERANLNDLVTQVCQLMQVVARKKEIRFDCSVPDEPIVTVCDADKIQQVLINLVDNAIKYTDKGGRVWMHLEKRDSQACLEVGDTGVGIKAEDQDKIFEMFGHCSLKGLMRKTGGFGVGLAVCKKLVEMHHGKIGVQSALGEGAVFSILLPFSAVKI